MIAILDIPTCLHKKSAFCFQRRVKGDDDLREKLTNAGVYEYGIVDPREIGLFLGNSRSVREKSMPSIRHIVLYLYF